MRVWIAEKPDAARSIAKAIGQGQPTKGDGYIQYGDDVFTWVRGHLLEPADPHHYNPEYKNWNYKHLPIFPDQWVMIEKPDGKGQLNVIKRLARKADTIVHAGDVDREGQLIVDEVLEHLKINKPTLRIQINDLNEGRIREAARNLKDNSEFANMSLSALLRQRADWTVGMNLSRAYTLLANDSGVFSVGRVQTPVLALIVHRDNDIENFVSKPFYELKAEMAGQGGRIEAKWIPSELYDDYTDEEGRILNRDVLDALLGKVANQMGKVTGSAYNKKFTNPPLGFSQSGIQTNVLKMKSVTGRPEDILNACQELYEKEKLLTYPRTDCPYIPESHHADAPKILAKLAKMHPELAEMVKKANPGKKSKAFNDSKISAHHAIVPTGEGHAALASLSPLKRTVFLTIAKNYIAQFLPPTQFLEAKLRFDVQGEKFSATRKQITDPGFGAWFGVKKDEVPIPVFNQGDPVRCEMPAIEDKQTTPPARFTMATIIEAMANIAKYVTDPDHKKVLKESDGIGTEATRANIISTLLKRNFITEKGKQVHSTPRARKFIGCVHEVTKSPGETALWEKALNQVSKNGDTGEFMKRIQSHVSQMIERLPDSNIAKKLNPHSVDCPDCGAPMRLRKSKNDDNEFFGCSKFPECKGLLNTADVAAEALDAAREMAAQYGKGNTRKRGRSTGSRKGGSGSKYSGNSRRATG